jgi:hypothetical protein
MQTPLHAAPLRRAIIASLIEIHKIQRHRFAGLPRRRHHQDRQRPSQHPNKQIDDLMPWAHMLSVDLKAGA